MMQLMKNAKSILLLEDDEIDVQNIKRVFSKLKFSNNLFVCEDGEKGLEWLVKHINDLPGLIILDLNMPKMNGIEFLQKIKEDKRFVRVPVMVLTTSAEQQDLQKCYDMSVSGYMVKPLDFKEFVHMFESIKNYWSNNLLSY